MSLSLDDLRHPDLRSRLRGYDRDEVDRLLAMVVSAVERLERRRRRDATALGELSKELATVQGRVEEAERRAAELAAELEAAEWEQAAATDRAREWERRAAEAIEQAERAQRALTSQHVAGGVGEETVLRLPLAQRAARAVLSEARAHAAAIVRQAEEQAEALVRGRSSEDQLGEATGYVSSSGSSETIQS